MTTNKRSELKDNLSSFVKQAADEDIFITNHGKAVAVLKGFEDEDDYLEYRLLNDPKFQKIVEQSRSDYKEGKVTKIEDLD